MRGLGAWGITVVRITMGVIVTVAGFKKWMAGIGVIAAGFEKIPIPLPWISAPFISTLELVGGVLLLLGFKTRWLGLCSRSSTPSPRSGCSSASGGGTAAASS